MVSVSVVQSSLGLMQDPCLPAAFYQIISQDCMTSCDCEKQKLCKEIYLCTAAAYGITVTQATDLR